MAGRFKTRAAMALAAMATTCLIATGTAYAESVSDRFSDVEAGAWYESEIQWVYDNGAMRGPDGSNTFGVGTTLTRAEFATALAKHSGADISARTDTTGLSDLAQPSWYTGACNWAYENGYITGYGGSNKFGPNDPVDRAQTMEILCRYTNGQRGPASALKTFPDAESVPDWAKGGAAWAISNGVITGSVGADGSKTIDPSRHVLREEFAKMLHGANGLMGGVSAFAVLSADDGSLSFYKRAGVPAEGGSFLGKTATAVFRGIEGPRDSNGLRFLEGRGVKSVSIEDDNITPTDCSFWFNDCSECTSMEGLNKLDMSRALDTSYMFNSCSSIKSLDLSGWDMSKVTISQRMFGSCQNLTSVEGLSEWNVSSLTDAHGMFASTGFTTVNLSGWSTSNLKATDFMFDQCSNLKSIKGIEDFNTSCLENIFGMFSDCYSLEFLDLSNWDTSNLKVCQFAFRNCPNLTTLDLSGWNTSKVTNLRSAFDGCSKLSSLDLSDWNTSNVVNMESLFSGCSSLPYVNVEDWNTSNVKTMGSTFKDCSALNVNCSSWDTSKVEYHSSFNEGASGVVAPNWVF